jgi:hypothetical protein
VLQTRACEVDYPGGGLDKPYLVLMTPKLTQIHAAAMGGNLSIPWNKYLLAVTSRCMAPHIVAYVLSGQLSESVVLSKSCP